MHNLNPYLLFPSGFLNRFESKEGSTIFTVMSILREGFQVVHNKGKLTIMCTNLVNFQVLKYWAKTKIHTECEMEILLIK